MNKKEMWSLAAKNGLILSSITVAIGSLTTFVSVAPEISILLTMVKFVAIGYILHYFMKQYSQEQDFVSYGSSFKYGLTICFLSSIICTAFIILVSFYLKPEVLDIALEQSMLMLEEMGLGGGTDFEAMKGMYFKSMPIAYLIYHMIFGLIYSSIIANFTKKDEMFPTSQDV